MRDSSKRQRVETERAAEFRRKRLETATAADFLGLAASTLTTWRCTKRYDLPYFKCGSRVYYDIADLEAFLESRKVRPAAPAEAR